MSQSRGRRAIDLFGDFSGELLGGMMGAPRSIGYAPASNWRPETDLYETADTYHVVLDLAGVDPEHLAVEMEGEVLTIRGVRMEGSRAGRRYHAMEIAAGPFERRVRVARPVELSGISASYQRGILEVRLPKAEERPAGRRRVPIG
ncbi:N/A [soil metagenome]